MGCDEYVVEFNTVSEDIILRCKEFYESGNFLCIVLEDNKTIWFPLINVFKIYKYE